MAEEVKEWKSYWGKVKKGIYRESENADSRRPFGESLPLKGPTKYNRS